MSNIYILSTNSCSGLLPNVPVVKRFAIFWKSANTQAFRGTAVTTKLQSVR